MRVRRSRCARVYECIHLGDISVGCSEGVTHRGISARGCEFDRGLLGVHRFEKPWVNGPLCELMNGSPDEGDTH